MKQTGGWAYALYLMIKYGRHLSDCERLAIGKCNCGYASGVQLLEARTKAESVQAVA